MVYSPTRGCGTTNTNAWQKLPTEWWTRRSPFSTCCPRWISSRRPRTTSVPCTRKRCDRVFSRQLVTRQTSLCLSIYLRRSFRLTGLRAARRYFANFPSNRTPCTLCTLMCKTYSILISNKIFILLFLIDWNACWNYNLNKFTLRIEQNPLLCVLIHLYFSAIVYTLGEKMGPTWRKRRW